MIHLKTILLDSKTRDLVLYHTFLKENNASLVQTKTMPFHAWLNQFLEEDKSSEVQTIILYKKLSNLKQSYPIYGKMFHYPQFVTQLVEFSRKLHSCILFNAFLPSPFCGSIVDSLPDSTQSDKELKSLLALCLNDDAIFSYNKELPYPFTELENIETVRTFYTDIFDDLIASKLIQESLKMTELSPIHSPYFTYRHALNPRVEIEAIAQEIIQHGTPAEDISIIAFESTYYDLIEQVFNQYEIPYGFVNRSELSQCFLHAYSLLQCYLKQDIESIMNALHVGSLDIPCNSGVQHFIHQYITSLDDLITPTSYFENIEHKILNRKECKIMHKEELDFNQFSELISPFVFKIQSYTNPSDILEEVYNQCVLMAKSMAKRDLYDLKTYFEDINRVIETKDDLNLALYQIKGKMTSITSSCLGCVCITDPTHIIPARKVAYIIGASQKNYPGFIPQSGIFDEAYCEQTPYPSMQIRFESYTKQLEWIKKCAQTIHFSLPLLDYQGKKAETAFEIEALVDEVTEFSCLLNDNDFYETHHLSSNLAQALFLKEQRLHGSISSFEQYFKCPYSYFLKYGIHVDDFEYTDIEANTVGTLQHAILESAIHLKGKDYAKITKEEMERISKPYMESLIAYLPRYTERLNLIYEKMISNLLISFEFLQEMEVNTSFSPKEVEYKFTSDYFNHITLRGIIDRIDFSYDLLRILDYKSSSKSLSETSIKAGLQLQLCTYLILANHLFNKKPVGAYYYSLKNDHINYPSIVQNKDDFTDWSFEDTQSEFIKNHQLSGWTLQELDTLDYTGTHIKNIRLTKSGLSYTLYDETLIEQCLTELYQLLYNQITSGKIEVDPVEGACTYCKYRPICRFKGQQKIAAPLVMTEASLKKGREDNEVE